MHHFLDIHSINPDDLEHILTNAQALKKSLHDGVMPKRLEGKQLAMIFEKPSTRTRTSFEVGMNQLGGNAILITSEQSQMDRGESLSDTAKVLSRYVDLIMIRCFKHETLTELADNASVPVINGLTDYSHPCQILADIMTFQEHHSNIKGKKVAWVGDGNNVTNSWIHAAKQFGFLLSIATPEELKPSDDILAWAKDQKADIHWTNDPKEAAKDADLLTTDTWVSMGDSNAEERKKLLMPYQVDNTLLSLCDNNAIFLHCLPAHRGEEVTDDVIDGPQSKVFDEAENRLHVQKSIMIWCLEN